MWMAKIFTVICLVKNKEKQEASKRQTCSNSNSEQTGKCDNVFHVQRTP